MFDGALANCTGSTYTIELQQGVKPYHSRPFHILNVDKATLRKEVNRFVEIEILKRINNSHWAALTFIISKKMELRILFLTSGS